MKRFILNLIVLIIPLSVYTQNFTISGSVENSATGEKLIGANIFSPQHDLGVSTNTYGFFSLTLPKDSVYLVVSYLGFAEQYFAIDLKEDTEFNIQLNEGEELYTVEVLADRFDKIEDNVQMSQLEIPVTQIKKLPALLGEVDVLKALQLMPGVQSGGEGTSGIYVRGGSPDQNLILLDGVPVYNVSHLFGVFSVFNADAIKNITLTKGGYPARYGGRLSSVLEINMKEGNMKEFHGEASIGLISSKATFEGPIEKDISSFIISARRTYLDLLAKPVFSYINKQNGGQSGIPGYYFYDINAKVNRKFGNKDRVYLSFYSGKDEFSDTYKSTQNSIAYEDKSALDWGNVISSMRWNHQFSNRLFSNTTAIYSKYAYGFGSSFSETHQNKQDSLVAYSSKYLSRIEDLGLKLDFDYVPNPKHYIRYGANAIHHTFKPGARQIKLEETNITPSDTTINQQVLKTLESAVYLEDEMKLFGGLKANIGVHASAFLVDDEYYTSIQPRIGLSYKFKNDLALKASYASMTQYIHLLTSGGLGLPADLWVPSTKVIRPQQSWQAAVGVAKTFNDVFEVSAEAYYKEMNGLLSYKEGVSFLDEETLVNEDAISTWQEKVTQGRGNSYGAEFFVQKKKGNTTGWLGYTISWNNRQYETINNGKWFPFKYDRRHDISLVVSHKINESISIAGSWVFGTGNAITVPTSKYNARTPFTLGDNNNYFERTYTNSNDRNNERMRNYHRLDLSAEFFKKKEKYERTWVIGAYNAYSRANPFYVKLQNNYNVDTGGSDLVVKQFSLFPIIPSIAWKVKF